MKSKYPGVYPVEGTDNRFVLRMCLTVNGKTHRDTRTITAGSPKKAYEQKIKVMDELKSKYESGTLVSKNSNMLFGELLNQWDKSVTGQVGTEGGLSYTTKETYDSIIKNYIRPYFRDIQVNSLNKSTFSYYRDFLRENYKLSEKTINNQMMLLRSICKYASDRNIIGFDPFFGFKAGKVEQPDIEYFTAQQIKQIKIKLNDDLVQLEKSFDSSIKYRKLAEDDREKRERLRYLAMMSKVLFVNIAMATGARRGEIIALDWSDIDFDNASIEFRGTCYSEKGTGSVKKETLKNGTKSKMVPICGQLVELLKQYKKLQSLVIRDQGWKSNNFIFIALASGNINNAGARANGDSYTSWFSNWCKANSEFIGLSEKQALDPHLHMFRHSFCTNLLSNGIDVQTIAYMAGHKDSSVTLKRYSHVVDENKRKAAEQLAGLYDSSNNEK